MYQCYSDISGEQLKHMYDLTPMLSEYIRLRGRVTHSELVEGGIKSGTTTINRDDLTHVRHWSELLITKKWLKDTRPRWLLEIPRSSERDGPRKRFARKLQDSNSFLIRRKG